MHILIMGPQGVGKGTQAVELAKRYDAQHISTGDIFRYNISHKTALGQKVQSVIDAGELVSDSLTGELVRDALSLRNAVEGFILDGYPRNHNQVVDLDGILAELGLELDAVVLLTAQREVLLERMLKRAELTGRSDDTPESIAKRLDIYDKETAPLINEYRNRDLLIAVDGTGAVEEVTKQVVIEFERRKIT
jgi:adenylate kinase